MPQGVCEPQLVIPDWDIDFFRANEREHVCQIVCMCFFNLRKIVASLWTSLNNPTFMKWLKPAGLCLEWKDQGRGKGKWNFSSEF